MRSWSLTLATLGNAMPPMAVRNDRAGVASGGRS